MSFKTEKNKALELEMRFKDVMIHIFNGRSYQNSMFSEKMIINQCNNLHTLITLQSTN
jgi:hypothetical protein